MGPRLVSRGDIVQDAVLKYPSQASMGPRLVSRGDSFRVPLPNQFDGFNGAAACEPRRQWVASLSGAIRQGFNGAAACEPRRPRSGWRRG